MVRRTRRPTEWRDAVVAVALLAVIGVLAAGLVRWRPTTAENDPYMALLARWRVNETGEDRAFVGLGIFTFRPNWEGPVQRFRGPVLLQVTDVEGPVRARFSGEVAVGRTGAGEFVTGAGTSAPAAVTKEVVLSRGDLIAVPAGTGFAIETGVGEVVRMMAIALLPNGPPATPGIEQVEWRAWGIVNPAPEAPLVVSVFDLELAGGETFLFRRDRGPALVSVEGLGDGAQSIALTVTKGRGVYQRVLDIPPYNLTGPVSYVAVQTPTTSNRERVFEGHSGAFLPGGTVARLRNRSLVDGTGAVLVTFDAPTMETPAPTPSGTPTAV